MKFLVHFLVSLQH